ncbi:hypothetical protein K438DRAFT_1940667 [Mycena galopus ATCC 62051]|nr:hypothetical protein K438DRAFT_1940667 [Mycena galopus ATCC 62051]
MADSSAMQSNSRAASVSRRRDGCMRAETRGTIRSCGIKCTQVTGRARVEREQYRLRLVKTRRHAISSTAWRQNVVKREDGAKTSSIMIGGVRAKSGNDPLSPVAKASASETPLPFLLHNVRRGLLQFSNSKIRLQASISLAGVLWFSGVPARILGAFLCWSITFHVVSSPMAAVLLFLSPGFPFTTDLSIAFVWSSTGHCGGRGDRPARWHLFPKFSLPRTDLYQMLDLSGCPPSTPVPRLIGAGSFDLHLARGRAIDLTPWPKARTRFARVFDLDTWMR